jgi:hypothetical protein
MTHIARPAPERMPNTKTTTPMVIFAGRLGHSTSVSYSTVSIGSLLSQGSAPTSRRKRLGPTPGTVLPGNHEVAQRDHGASTNYTKRAFSRDPPAIRSTS